MDGTGISVAAGAGVATGALVGFGTATTVAVLTGGVGYRRGDDIGLGVGSEAAITAVAVGSPIAGATDSTTTVGVAVTITVA